MNVGRTGRPRGVVVARCPEHPRGHVVSNGTRTRGGGRYQRFRCTPVPGADPHQFELALGEDGLPVVRGWSPAPVCPKHPQSKVTRDGTYGVRTPVPRQRYRCTPSGPCLAENCELTAAVTDGASPAASTTDPKECSAALCPLRRHSFTPPLPRQHVHDHESGCATCDELRGLHRGETAVARQHSLPTRIVARALEQLANAGSYGDVSRQALAAAQLAAQRHHDLVAAGLSDSEAEAQIDAELAEADTASLEALAADLPRYRRKRRSDYEIACDDARAQGLPLPEAPEPGRRKSTGTRMSNNAWHLAAGWVEAFSPVV